MKIVGILMLAVLCALAISGCYTLNAIGTPADPAISMSNHPTGTTVKHFSVTMKVNHIIFGLVTLNDPEIAKIVSDQVKSAGGKNAINVKFTYQMTFIDGLLNMITFSIYNPFTLTLEGDVVK